MRNSGWLLGVVAGGALWLGCAPGLTGRWDASGEVEQRRLFGMDLTFQSDEAGTLTFTDRAPGSTGRPLTTCKLTLADGALSFQLDPQAAPNATCASLARPLTFKGTLGHDVIAGDITDAAGNRVGMWRAFRKPTE